MHEEASLRRQINSKEEEKRDLRKKIRRIEEKKARNEEARNDLREAERKKRKAESDGNQARVGRIFFLDEVPQLSRFRR